MDETGKVEEPDTYAYRDGEFNIRPYPFRKSTPPDVSWLMKLVIEIRDQERAKIIEKGFHEAENFSKVYKPYR